MGIVWSALEVGEREGEADGNVNLHLDERMSSLGESEKCEHSPSMEVVQQDEFPN